MALLFSTDFESGATLTSMGFSGASLDTGGSVSINNTSGKGHASTYAMANGSGGQLIGVTRGDGSGALEGRAVFDFYFDTPFTAVGPFRFFDFVYNNNKIVSLWVDSSDNILIRDGSGGAGDGATVATLSGIWVNGTWATFDVRFKQAAGTGGSCVVLINGTVVYNNDGGFETNTSTLLSAWTGTRWVFYSDMRVDNLSIYDNFSATGGSGSEPTYDNAVLTVGLTWVIVTCRSGTQYVWSDKPLPDPSTYYLGWKEPRVLVWGDMTRALSNIWDGQYESSSCQIVLSDWDRALRQLDADNELINATAVVYMISDDDRRALKSARVVYRGVIREANPQPELKFQITIKDIFSFRYDANTATEQIPKRLITTTDFANCAADTVTSSAEGYVVNGAVSAGENKIPVKSGWGVFAEGDTVAINGAFYQVASASSDFVAAGIDAETYIVIDPVLGSSAADGDTITVQARHRITPAVGQRVPIWYGHITDLRLIGSPATDAGDGQAKAIYVGDKTLGDGKTYGEFLWAGHACYGGAGSPSAAPIQMLYFWNESLDNYGNGTFFPNIGTLATEAGSGGRIAIPGYGNWSTLGFTTSYVDYNGRRYTRFFMRGIFRDWALGIQSAPDNLGGVPFAIDAYGADDVGDGSGALIQKAGATYLHILQNWCRPSGDSYQSGAWLTSPTFADDPTLPMFDEQSFADFDTLAAAKVDGGLSPNSGFLWNGGIGANNEAISMRELIARMNVSCGSRSGFNRKIQYFIMLLNTDLASTTLQTELGWERDIFAGSWQIVPDTTALYTSFEFRHTQDFFERASGGWRSIEVGDSPAIDTGAESTLGERTIGPEVDFYFIRGKNRSSDPDEYQPGTDLVAFLVSLRKSTNATLRRVAHLGTGPNGFNYELGDIVPLTHYEGLSSSGWTSHNTQLERITVQPSAWTTLMELFDVDAIIT